MSFGLKIMVIILVYRLSLKYSRFTVSWVIDTRARQLKIIFQGSRVGGNIDQNEPLRLGPMSFGLKLMDHGHFEVLKMH